MPKIKRNEDGELSWLKLYSFLGVELLGPVNSKQHRANCPMCNNDKGKLFINSENGLWDCKTCSSSGNPVIFLRKLHKTFLESTTQKQYETFSKQRGVSIATLKKFGIAMNSSTGCWLLPSYQIGDSLTQLYQYVRSSNGKHRMYATPEMGQGLLGVPLLKGNDNVFLCEGFGDTLKLWECLATTKEVGEGESVVYKNTAAESTSLLSSFDVLGLPGSSVFKTEWTEYTHGKNVILLLDNDDAGKKGLEKLTHLLTGKNPPASIYYLKWDEQLQNGYDINDLLKENKLSGIEYLMNKTVKVPDEWKAQEAKCQSWKELENSWRKAMRWTEGLDRGLSVMLASIISTPALGDPLWVKIIGPASCGKSTLCEAISRNKARVLAKSSIRGFHSGYKTGGGEDQEDNSLLIQLKSKTLVTKDGDTLLQSPNLPQILSEARDIYDGSSRTHYRNKMSKDYTGIRMTWILCGTSSLRSIDSSELGERFLDCVIMEGIDDDLEDEVLLRVANRTDMMLSLEANDTEVHPELDNAMALTSGYVTYLSQDVQRKTADVMAGDAALRQCIDLGKFVAYMRARPSDRQEENASREFGARLVSQLVRLAKFLAVVLQKKELDKEVMRRVTRVALDTARGRVYNICDQLYYKGSLDIKTLSLLTNNKESRDEELLKFLLELRAVEFRTGKPVGARQGFGGGKKLWSLSEKMKGLFKRVTDYAKTKSRK